MPTGFDVTHKKVYVAQSGPEPHDPEDGKVVSLNRRYHHERLIASGEPMIVDVELSRCDRLYALSNGESPAGEEIEPAVPNTGAFLRVKHGDFTMVLDGLNLPVSVDFIRGNAYITSLTGEVAGEGIREVRTPLRN